MMDVLELLRDLTRSGIILNTYDDRLIVTGRRDQLTPSTIENIRTHKPDLLKHLLKTATVSEVAESQNLSTCGTGTIDISRSRYENWKDLDLFEMIDERIAIMHFDGHVPLSEAQKLALEWLREEIGELRFSRIA